MSHAPDSRRIRTFRHWAPVFEVLDHDSVPTSVVVLAAGSVVLVGLALAEGRPMRADAAGPTLLAVLALTALGAALVMAAGEALAWLLAIPVGRDVARAAASLEGARVAVGRIHAIPAPDDADLHPSIARIDRSADRLRRWLADADAGLVTWATLPDPATRASRLGLLREEGRQDRCRGRGARRGLRSRPLDRDVPLEPASPRRAGTAAPRAGCRRATRGRPRLTRGRRRAGRRACRQAGARLVFRPWA